MKCPTTRPGSTSERSSTPRNLKPIDARPRHTGQRYRFGGAGFPGGGIGVPDGDGGIGVPDGDGGIGVPDGGGGGAKASV